MASHKYSDTEHQPFWSQIDFGNVGNVMPYSSATYFLNELRATSIHRNRVTKN